MQEIMIRETQSLIDRRKEDPVDKNNRRESLIQSEEIDEEEHVVFTRRNDVGWTHINSQ